MQPEPDDLMPFDPMDEDNFQRWWEMLDEEKAYEDDHEHDTERA